MSANTAPPRVISELYPSFGGPPPERSARCTWWCGRIEAGWRPNSRIQTMDPDTAAGYFGVYDWEYIHVLYPMMVKP